MKKSKLFTHGWKAVSIILFTAGFLLSTVSSAQQDKKFILEGNKQYQNKNYTEAAKNYSKALNKNKQSYKGAFNLGDAYYQQGKYAEAAEQFQSLTHHATSKDTLSKAYHNLGNSLLKLKKYQESIDAYKNALKNNPDDEDTRYNLSYAQQMLKQKQDQQKKDKDKDKKDNKDKQNKDQKNKDQQKKDNKDQNKDNKNDQNKDKQEQQNKISKQDAQRLLDALQSDEKNLHDKAKKGTVHGVKVQIEKDW